MPARGGFRDLYRDSCPGDPDAARIDAAVSDAKQSRFCGPEHSLGRRAAGPRDIARPEDPADPSVSLTTLAAPKEARKAYEKGRRELNKKTPDPGRAAQELEKAVELYPGYAIAWDLLGAARLAVNDFTGAGDALKRAMAADPKYLPAYLRLALMEVNSGRFAEAAGLAGRAVRLNPNVLAAHYLRAVAHYGLGELGPAKESALVILNSGQARRYPWVRALLGDIYAAEGKPDAASREYHRFLELESDSLRAGLVRKRLEECKGRKD